MILRLLNDSFGAKTSNIRHHGRPAAFIGVELATYNASGQQPEGIKITNNSAIAHAL